MRSILPIPTVSRRAGPRGFTLVELLVVVAVMLALTTMTIVAVNFSNDRDRVRAGARLIQSLLSGARDRAIYSREIRGIRLIRDPNDSHSANAIQYIGAPGRISDGTLTVMPNLDGTVINGSNTLFNRLKSQGLIRVGSRIQIPKDTGRWYTIAAFPASETIWLAQRYADYSASTTASNANRSYSGLTYQLELLPQPLPDSTPVQLPRGVVIDLDGSLVPDTWRPTLFVGAYSNQMDLLFSAKGLPVGDAVSKGMIHFHIADAGDVIKFQQINGRSAANYVVAALPLVPATEDPTTTPATAIVKRDRIGVTLASRTGRVSVHAINVTNNVVSPTAPIELQKLADDPYFFAESGEVAK
ncbi:MAG: prepilin-type N-terminal cleavage/methylation domain-containing protein [Planctomycetes bacterium]|nr:prepilin-type N-terminal cleavage/methylation domain-containing protein [Planctomycetota bacterium]